MDKDAEGAGVLLFKEFLYPNNITEFFPHTTGSPDGLMHVGGVLMEGKLQQMNK